MRQLGGRVNLVICQKSKIDDWFDHFEDNYYSSGADEYIILPHDLTDPDGMDIFKENIKTSGGIQLVGIINYDLIFRRPELLKMKFDTIMLDESSMIQNETAKRTKAIMKLKTDNVILLSGTPTGGKYEKLYSQLKLLGWNISKSQYWTEFIETRSIDMGGFKIPVVTGYKNIGRLKRKMRQYGCNFLKTDDVFDLPEQTFTDIKINTTKEYKKFRKDKIITIYGRELVGDTTLTQMLYERQLCGAYNAEKLAAFADIMDSTNDRLIVFYNFNVELDALKTICEKRQRPFSIVSGAVKDLDDYKNENDSVTFIQYQAGAMGLNLQKANKIIYFTPPLSSELYEQSKKRIHRIGQERPCFYYRLICKNSIEEKIYKTLEMRRDYTERLFVKG
jgi:SNF2 family DNA or RNA helicase